MLQSTNLLEPLAQPPASQPAVTRMSVLVAIASYGTGQDHFLERVVAEFLQLDMDCRIVILSNVAKRVEGAEVLVGLPSRDTYSLPFAHRALFIRHANDYDLFIYTEDDTPITPKSVHAFLEVQRQLPNDHVAGFLRSETLPEGGRCIVSANHFFRWVPGSVIAGSNDRFARFSNQHSGCFMVTRQQLQLAIASGGFSVEPRAGRYGMLETAASDIHTQCGLTRVICISRLNDFIVPHLANKYYRTMGMAEAEFSRQVSALLQIDRDRRWCGSLFEPETRAPGFRWSKHLYRAGGDRLLSLIPSGVRRLLSLGATTGQDEATLTARRIAVSIVPLDAILGHVLKGKGFDVHDGPLTEAMAALPDAHFDAILIADALHLLPDPLQWLRDASRTLVPGGHVVGSISHTSSWYWPLQDWRRGNLRWIQPDFDTFGAHPIGPARLASLARSSGMELRETVAELDDAPSLERIRWAGLRLMLAPELLFRMQRPA